MGTLRKRINIKFHFLCLRFNFTRIVYIFCSCTHIQPCDSFCNLQWDTDYKNCEFIIFIFCKHYVLSKSFLYQMPNKQLNLINSKTSFWRTFLSNSVIIQVQWTYHHLLINTVIFGTHVFKHDIITIFSGSCCPINKTFYCVFMFMA